MNYIHVYEVWLKSSKADQDTLIEIRFIFQQSPPFSSHTSSIGVAELGSHWSKISTTDMMSAYELLSPPVCVCVCV